MTTNRQGMLYVLSAAILWGSSGICAQYLMTEVHISAAWLTMLRMLFSAPLILMVAWLKGRNIWRIFTSAKDLLALLIFSIFGMLAVQMTFLLAIEHSNAATATVLHYVAPVIVVIWFSLVKHSFAGMYVYMAIAIALSGIFLIATQGNPWALAISLPALLWGISSAFATAFYSIFPAQLIARYGTMTVVGWSMLIAGMSFLPFHQNYDHELVITRTGLFCFVYFVICGTALGFSFYLKGAQLIGGQKATIISCTEPLISAGLSVLILSVHFSWISWLGTLMVCAAVLIAVLDPKALKKQIHVPDNRSLEHRHGIPERNS